jgi:hypothetical protein
MSTSLANLILNHAFAQGSMVTIRSTGATSTAPKLRAQYSAATVICIGVNEFLVVGDLS